MAKNIKTTLKGFLGESRGKLGRSKLSKETIGKITGEKGVSAEKVISGPYTVIEKGGKFYYTDEDSALSGPYKTRPEAEEELRKQKL